MGGILDQIVGHDHIKTIVHANLTLLDVLRIVGGQGDQLVLEQVVDSGGDLDDTIFIKVPFPQRNDSLVDGLLDRCLSLAASSGDVGAGLNEVCHKAVTLHRKAVNSLTLILLHQTGNALSFVHIVHIEGKVVRLVNVQLLALIGHSFNGDILTFVLANGRLTNAQDLNRPGILNITFIAAQTVVHQLALQFQVVLDLLRPDGLNKIGYCHSKKLPFLRWEALPLLHGLPDRCKQGGVLVEVLSGELHSLVPGVKILHRIVLGIGALNASRGGDIFFRYGFLVDLVHFCQRHRIGELVRKGKKFLVVGICADHHKSAGAFSVLFVIQQMGTDLLVLVAEPVAQRSKPIQFIFHVSCTDDLISFSLGENGGLPVGKLPLHLGDLNAPLTVKALKIIGNLVQIILAGTGPQHTFQSAVTALVLLADFGLFSAQLLAEQVVDPVIHSLVEICLCVDLFRLAPRPLFRLLLNGFGLCAGDHFFLFLLFHNFLFHKNLLFFMWCLPSPVRSFLRRPRLGK
nr:MAG TPA: Keratinocyte differentiation-associated [Caudoviricetes sp.]